MSSETRTVVVSRPLHRPRGGEEGEELWNEEGGGHEYGRELNLMMICCEENEPYGPALDTATMFLELLCASYERYHHHHHREHDDDHIDDENDASSNYSEQRSKGVVVDEDEDKDEDEDGAGGDAKRLPLRRIQITVYHAQKMDYPQSDDEWDGYDGIIIPGSLSAAYDTHIGWIRRLLNVIRTEIHDKRRKTMGVCFGHQCLAHSFRHSSSSSSSSSSADDDDDYSDHHRGDDTGAMAEAEAEEADSRPYAPSVPWRGGERSALRPRGSYSSVVVVVAVQPRRRRRQQRAVVREKITSLLLFGTTEERKLANDDHRLRYHRRKNIWKCCTRVATW